MTAAKLITALGVALAAAVAGFTVAAAIEFVGRVAALLAVLS